MDPAAITSFEKPLLKREARRFSEKSTLPLILWSPLKILRHLIQLLAIGNELPTRDFLKMSAPHFLMTYRMNLISDGSISLDSTFNIYVPPSSTPAFEDWFSNTCTYISKDKKLICPFLIILVRLEMFQFTYSIQVQVQPKRTQHLFIITNDMKSAENNEKSSLSSIKFWIISQIHSPWLGDIVDSDRVVVPGIKPELILSPSQGLRNWLKVCAKKGLKLRIYGGTILE
jgi:hypothetical protein